MVESAAARIGRTINGHEMLQRLFDAGYSNPRRDLSPESALAANVEELFMAGYDDEELARAIHERECDPDVMVPYSDTKPFLRALRANGVRAVVVSNCGFDIRQNLRSHGLHELIDGYVLSCEHGVVKPDRELFEIALGDYPPEAALMVGDSSADAGAIKIGIETILFPAASSLPCPRGFDLVLDAVGIPASS